MKKIAIYLLSALMLAGCAKLDPQPTQSVTADDAIKTPSDLNQAMTGCYDALQLAGFYGRHSVFAADLASDNANATGTILEYSDISLNNMLSGNSIVESVWYHSYITINRANNVLYYLPNVENLEESFANDVKGQMYFLRSLAYFNLIRYFGDVPLKTTPTLSTDDLDSPRVPVSDILTQIIPDLEFAISNISGSEPAKATPGAAEALLAKVFLYAGEYENAILHASAVINDYQYELDDFEALFGIETSAGSIFEVNYSDQDKNRMAEYALPTSMGGRYEVSPTEDLLGKYTDDDIRKNITFSGIGEAPYCIKYSQISSGADKVYVLRLAEMYLIRAEARILLEDPNFDLINNDINAVRERANLDPLNLNSYDELLEEMLLQRQLEFAFEGHRWFDLLRNNKAIEVLPNVNNLNQLLFPIPLSEINTNTLINSEDQNPGY